MATSTLGSGTLVLAGTTSGTTTLQATAVAGTTTLTLPAATDTLVGKATTDTLTNKTLTGAAMNGTLGATTPSTGAFTTLSTSGAFTTTGGSNVQTSWTLAEAGTRSLVLKNPTSTLNASVGTGTNHDLQIEGNSLYFLTGSFGSRSTAGTFDSSGNLLVGTTSANASAHHVLQYSDTAKFAAAVVNSSASTSALGLYVNYSLLTPNGTGSEFIYCADFTALRMSVRSNGGIANYSANNVNLSDRREKTNFAPSKSYLDVICAIPVQTFNYIDQNMEDDGGLTLGVVAQDVQAVAPEMVMESNWGTKEEPKMRLSIYQTDLQYALMKCIQEQQVLITQLQADVAALKGA